MFLVKQSRADIITLCSCRYFPEDDEAEVEGAEVNEAGGVSSALLLRWFVPT
jgi:hypothetical protein